MDVYIRTASEICYKLITIILMFIKGLRVECVHPMTRRSCHLPAVVNPSNRHDSTGSTVDTFLPQRNLNQAILFEPVLMTINDDEDDRDDDGNDYGGVD